jgi:hypothetical protein
MLSEALHHLVRGEAKHLVLDCSPFGLRMAERVCHGFIPWQTLKACVLSVGCYHPTVSE